jgi:putative resolvase
MLKTFQYRLYPSKPQKRLLEQTLETCRHFYNACLDERKTAWEERKESVGKFAQMRQVKTANGWTHETVTDLGSGMNYNKRGLQGLIKRICQGDISRLVLTHKDRLLRFGGEIIFTLCETFNVEVVIINQGDRPLNFEEELVQDVLEIITVFSARLYGSRSHKNKKLVEALKEAAEDL